MRPWWLQHHSPGVSLGLLLLLALPGVTRGSFEVHALLEPPVVEHGGSIWINCSHTCDDRDAPGGLETSLTKSRNGSGPGWTAFHLRNVQQWESNLQCYFTCHGNTAMTNTTLSAYRAPERVVLEPLPVMELGQAYNLTCRVLAVAPVRHLSVTLLQGGRALHTETFGSYSGAELDNITVTHPITPGHGDHGQRVTCQAGLDLRPHGPLLQNSSVEEELRVFDKPWLDDSGCPRNQMWVAGTEQTLSCAAKGNPPPAVQCSKDGRNVSTTAARRVGSEDAGTYVCEASNEVGSARREVTVHVEHPKPNYLLWVLRLLAVAIALVSVVLYALHYHAHKIGSYWLPWHKPSPQAQPPEETRLNGAAPSAPDAECSV